MTEIKSEFRTKLEEFKNEYEAERKGFNIFKALHKEHDEKYLHSRFISYLLSPASTHGMGNLFLKLFIDRVSEAYPDLLNFKIDNCTVQPNEEDKSEDEYIDIYIQSHDKKQVIIIENKIFAKASYHTTEDGKEQHQIDTYCDKKKDNKEDIFAIYLAPHRRDPEKEGIERKPIIVIEYQKEIIEWINKCIEVTENSFLEEVLSQYKSVVHSFTSNLDRVDKIKKLLNNENNIKEAWEIKDFIMEKEKNANGEETNQIKWGDFKHVQWHTIADFWDELAERLGKEPINAKITNRITIEEISGIIHKNRKGSYGLTFELGNGQEWYIVNDNINGISFGKILPDEGEEEKKWYFISENIKFTDFSNKDTFMLINAKKRGEKIDEIINTLKANPLLMNLYQ